MAGEAALDTFLVRSAASAEATDCMVNNQCPAIQAIKGGFGDLSVAEQYGIDSYNNLNNQVNETGLEVHHIIEQRLAAILGYTQSSTGRWPSVVLTSDEHQMFTDLWRYTIGYGMGYSSYTANDVWNAAQAIYKDYPALLAAAEHTILGQ